MKTMKKIGGLLLAFCICVVSLLSPVKICAQTTEESDKITLRIGDQVYENIQAGSVITGNFDLENLEFWIDSFNGSELVNVGNNSGVTDSEGRNPLEIATIEQNNTLWEVTLIYHAGDDPTIANQSHQFFIPNLKFINTSKLTEVKASAKKKALKLTWKSRSVDGYQIQYSTKKNFKSVKTVKVSKDKTSYTIKSLKSKKVYYVRIRGYITCKNEANEKQTFYGKWATVSKKTK